MAAKRLLIADADARSWDEFRHAMGEAWEVIGAASGAAALEEAERKPFDIVVSNFDLPEWGGAELLNRLRLANPKTQRFIAAPEAMKEKVMHSVLGGDQFLGFPYNRDTLKASIDRSLAADYGMSSSVRELVGRIRTFPTIPSLYLEVVNALQDPHATTADIGEIISKDMSMTTKLVQVLNSAYFGLPRTITDPTEAVGILGFETVKSLIMAVKLLSQYDKVKPVYFSIDNVWRHSTNVARTARVMALLETNDMEKSATAYTAGLMHDLGKVILAANFDSQYHGAHTVARKQRIPLWEVEKDIFGATHGEIGAYLLALWGMSEEVVRVAALHHDPMRAGDKEFSALTAVHVANALEYEGAPETDGLPSPVADSAYLESLNMADRVELWRFARREPDAARSDTKLQRTKMVSTEAPAPAVAEVLPEVETVPTPAPSNTPFYLGDLWKWLALGGGVAAALAFSVHLALEQMEHPLATPAAVNQNITEAPVAAVSASLGAPVKTVSAPTPRLAYAPVVRPRPEPEKTAFDQVKLQAIFYSSQHPTALINGQLASVNEEVADCRVLDISPKSITLAYRNEQRTLTLR